MARYIDADNLIAHLKDEIEGCKQPFGTRANGKGIVYGTELGLKSAISFAKTLSTADVVPKSEVEKAKQEVAREIFEEIEELDIQLNNGDLDIKYFGSAIANLKKKHTESEGKG